MATQTTNYNLVKPALTDSPPDITVMNPNWDKIDSELKINSSAIGKIDTNTFKNYLGTGGVITNGNFNNLTIHGEYILGTGSANAPTSENYWNVLVFGGDEATQIATNLLNKKTYMRTYNTGSGWGAWQEISYTAAMVLSTLNGWQGEMTIAKSGQMVVINISILAGTVTNGTILANVPVMYRPIRNNYAAVHSDNGYAYIVKISTDGNISIDNFATDWTNSHKIGCIAYSLI